MGRQTLIDSIDDRLIASPTGDYLNIFDVFDGAVSGNSVYNTNLWNGAAADLFPALTGIAWMMQNPTSTGLIPDNKGVAISRRHILISGHMNITPAGLGTVRWILANGTFVDGTAIDRITDVGSEYTWTSNTTLTGAPLFHEVLYLNADLPGTVPLTPIFSPTYLDASTVQQDMKPVDSVALDAAPVVPVIRFDQFHRMTLSDSYHMSAAEYEANQMYFLATSPPLASIRRPYWQAGIPGDSGSTILALYGSQFIYVGAIGQVFSNLTWSPHTLWFVQSIINACATLDARNAQTGYTPEFFTFPEDMGYVTTRDYARTAITVSDEAG